MKRFKKAKDIKVGVIGYSGAFCMGRVHLEDLKAAGMTPTAVCEINKDLLKVAAAEWPGIEAYDSIPKMLRKSDVDLLAVITPHNLHAKHVIQCLDDGRSVCCEKPLAITTEECDRMIASAKKNRCLLTTYHNRHWDGCILTAMKMMKRRVIGDVYRIEAHMGGYSKPGPWWRSSKSISGGILYDWGVHVLEYALQIMDSDIAEVSGFASNGFWAPKTKWKDDTHEDEAMAMVRFTNGKWMCMSSSCVESNPKSGVLEFTGTKGTYLMSHEGWVTITHKKGEAVRKEGANPPGEWGRYYQNIADHLVKGAELVITPEWSRRPIHILDLAGRSAKKGAAIKAKYK